LASFDPLVSKVQPPTSLFVAKRYSVINSLPCHNSARFNDEVAAY